MINIKDAYNSYVETFPSYDINLGYYICEKC